ncbi:MAG: MFS transporter [Enterocloster bolteae]
MDAVKEKRYYGWYMVMVSAIIYALVYSTTSTGSVFTISITQEQGFSRSLWSSKSIFTCIGSLISCYMSGRLIQRFGLKRIMLISTAGVASTFFIPLMFTDIRQYYVLSVYSSATWCAATIMSVPILINRWFGPKKKGIAISLALAGSGVGSMLMSPLLSYLCENYGWRKT